MASLGHLARARSVVARAVVALLVTVPQVARPTALTESVTRPPAGVETASAGGARGPRSRHRPPPPDLARVNDALAAWLGLIDADRPFLVLDGRARQLRLHHGRALLRADSVLAVDPGPAGVQHLAAPLRRYRRADPFHEIEPGPFDWEDYLVVAATDAAALWFDGGLLVFADAAWLPARPPSVRLAPGSLRALYDALETDTPLVVLPAGWDTLGSELPLPHPLRGDGP